MNRLPFALMFFLGLMSTAEGFTVPADDDSLRPNILYVYVDDMGWGSIGPNGQAERRQKNLPNVKTPNIDRLAAQGINFLRGYGCHVCSPARSSQQTGFHQGHTFADRNDPDNAKKAIRADDITMGDALSKAGYTTGYWGKWGYGGSKAINNPVIQNIQTLPTSHGYQFVLAELHHVRAHTFFQPTLWSAPAPNSTGGLELIANSMSKYRDRDRFPPTPAMQSKSGYPDVAYCDDAYAFAALEFIRTQGQHYNRTGQPFFGLLAVQIPHAPFQEITQLPEWDRDYSDDPHFTQLADQSKQWCAMVTRMDAHLGNLLAALDDPNNDGDTSDSVSDNTIVIFQSDNGGPGGKSLTQLDANGGLRGTKGKIQEGGIRVPLVIRWPAKIHATSPLKAGTNCDQIVDVTDLLPTFCEIAGSSPPLGIDGVSIAPMLTGVGHQRHREFIIHEAGNGQSIIRGRHKLVRAKRGQPKLYDLEADPAESKDLANNHPKLVAELESLLLGERVSEPKGFANTYHRWIGPDDEKTSNASHWSDYQYANEDITYMSDSGPPQLSWIARIDNDSKTPRNVNADTDINVLALEIRGGSPKSIQSLTLGPNVNLTGRNEIRLSQHSSLAIDDGTVKSLRWIDIAPSASVTGSGSIEGVVYNCGTVEVCGKQTQLHLSNEFHQTKSGTLRVQVFHQSDVRLQIEEQAFLDGRLELATGSEIETGQSVRIIDAKQIRGRFANPNDEVLSKTGSRYKIEYSRTAVKLVRM